MSIDIKTNKTRVKLIYKGGRC